MPVNKPSKVTDDAMYDTAKINKYNRGRRIKFNMAVNKKIGRYSTDLISFWTQLSLKNRISQRSFGRNK